MRMFIILAAAVSLFALSGCALTQSGTVWKIDGWDRTVAIGNAIYHVTDDTRFFGSNGNAIPIDAVPSAADPRIGSRYLAQAEVDFRARKDGERLLLDKLWLRPRRESRARSQPMEF